MSISNPDPDSESRALHETQIFDGSVGSSEKGVSPTLDEEAVLSTSPNSVIDVPALTPYSLIDGDQRYPIRDTNFAPWRMVCSIRAWYGDRLATFGTGWLAGPSTVVTAGHIVYFPNLVGVPRNKRWATAVQVVPGQNGGQSAAPPMMIRGGGRFEVLEQWYYANEHLPDPNYDLACIHLTSPIGLRLGTFSFGAVQTDRLENVGVNITGYPTNHGGTVQFNHRDRVLHADSNRLFYATDASQGQSGSPAWILDSTASRPVVVATHTYGTSRTPPALGITANSGTRITPHVYNEIKTWTSRS